MSPLEFPSTEKDIFNRALADFQSELPNAGPFLRDSFIYALLVAYSARNFDNYQMLKQILLQMFPDTATGDYLERWGGYIKVNRLAPSKSSGNITVTGAVASSIPLGTEFQTLTGNEFISLSAATVASQTFSVASLTRVGNTVTVTTSGNHQFATGVDVTISGATQTAYNGTFSVVVTSQTQFVYTITAQTLPATPATGTILASFTGATVNVESVGTGTAQNLESGTQLSLVTPLTGIDTNAYVQFTAISGGEDTESDDRYRKRVLYKYQNPVALFNVSNITATAMELSFVNRVFVKEITPAPGQVTVYITKDAASGNVIPTGSEVQQVKDHLLTIKPAHVDSSDVIVSAPTPVTVNFEFSDLIPNTVTMQNAVIESLKVLFNEQVEVGVSLLRAAYESAIYQTVDLVTGEVVESFTLTTPTGTVAITSAQLPILGTVVFS